MAFRIHESVARGEIDNRVKGIVRGRIWLAGRAKPLLLKLHGNAHRDLAGCLLRFTNPCPPIPHPHLDFLRPYQYGTVGDLTASRRVRVFDIPLEQALEMLRRAEAPPEHKADCLYLEWFSHRNGRVVVESTDYQLTLSAPQWRLTAEDEQQREKDAAAGLSEFLRRALGKKRRES